MSSIKRRLSDIFPWSRRARDTVDHNSTNTFSGKKSASTIEERLEEAVAEVQAKTDAANTSDLSRLSRVERIEAMHKARQINKLNSIPKGEKILPNTEGNIIDVVDVAKQYTNKIMIFSAIANVNLTVKRGEFVVIQGPSGSGKSTLLNILSGLDRPTSGKIIVNGVNIAALKDGELTRFRRETTGFIFQAYNLLPSLNVVENAKIGQSLQSDREKRLPMAEVLEEIGIQAHSHKNINEISGGQQQRVSIARAISKNPLVLFADEPTGALDEVSAKAVLVLFERISRKHGMTVVLVTHDPRIALIADKVVRVRNGAIESVQENWQKISPEEL